LRVSPAKLTGETGKHTMIVFEAGYGASPVFVARSGWGAASELREGFWKVGRASRGDFGWADWLSDPQPTVRVDCQALRQAQGDMTYGLGDVAACSLDLRLECPVTNFRTSDLTVGWDFRPFGKLRAT